MRDERREGEKAELRLTDGVEDSENVGEAEREGEGEMEGVLREDFEKKEGEAELEREGSIVLEMLRVPLALCDTLKEGVGGSDIESVEKTDREGL